MKRDDNIELLRCLAMLGVCVFHSTQQIDPLGFEAGKWIAFLAHASVPCFVFITGYYGIRLKPMRLAGLYLMAAYCWAVSCLFSGGGGGVNLFASNAWFLHAYALLMCFSPLLNSAFGDLNERKRMLNVGMPILFVVFCWGKLFSLPVLCHWNWPQPEGLCANSFLTLMGYYIVARLYRAFELERKILVWSCWVVILLVPTCSIYGFGGYSSPLMVLLAMAVFTLFKRLQLGVGAQKIMGCVERLIVPSLFVCYLFHMTPWGAGIHRSIKTYVNSFGLNFAIADVLIGTGIFACGLVADIPRRLLVLAICKIKCADGGIERCQP